MYRHRATVRVWVLLSERTYQERLRDVIEVAVRPLPGVRALDLELTPLTDAARANLARRLRESHGRPGALGSRTRIYAVGSGKGGVGKSTVTANLAVALARTGQKVAVLDADVWGYSVPQLFGLHEAPVALQGLMLPPAAHGVSLMSIGFFVSPDEPVVWRGPMLQKALEQLLDDVYWGDPDVLLVDLPPGTGDVPLSVLQLLPDAALLLVTTPQAAATTVAARIGRMALDSRMPLAGVVENMTGSVFGSGGGAELAKTLGTTLLGQIPLDEDLRRGGDDGIPLVAADPIGTTASVLTATAAALPQTRRSLAGRSLPLFVTSQGTTADA
ncbi:Mrp/NBP35 family ATP-binding protein [Segeticoccus rhizosphaerae]|uniref:Mrp/NBP35 family ATP-binding protein n=1 Tax=Segeticoccus rhizosphaerae TaxID=1104777 RepID=UPI001EE43884|nr:Mrp/NBP35 family ATP-binding protein [Ornithinicoccus soli]